MLRLYLATAALALAAPTAASDWQDIRDPQVLKGIYSNKTFRGKDWMDRPWAGHYRADGRGILVTHDGSRIPRRWAVHGNDQVCVESQFPRACYRFQRHVSKAGVYRVINVANDEMMEVTVEDGVPKF